MTGPRMLGRMTVSLLGRGGDLSQSPAHCGTRGVIALGGLSLTGLTARLRRAT